MTEQQHNLHVDGSVTGCRNSSQQGFAYLMKSMSPHPHPPAQFSYLYLRLSRTYGPLPSHSSRWQQTSTIDAWNVASGLPRWVKLEATFKNTVVHAPGRTCLITFENNHVERLFIVFAVTFLCRGDCQAKIKLIAGR